MNTIIAKIDQLLLDYLFPPRCPICDRIQHRGKTICDSCRNRIVVLREPVCKKCGKALEKEDGRREFCYDCTKKVHNYLQGKALWKYEGAVKRSVYRFKYKNKREYAEVYAEELATKYGRWIMDRGVTRIVPVPIHHSKKRARGYNQAELIACRLGIILDIPVDTSLVIRVKNTQPQKELNDIERKNNLKKAFKITNNIVKLDYIQDCVLIVDDIYTTGSTMDAVAECLSAAGVLKIYALSLCIGNGY